MVDLATNTAELPWGTTAKLAFYLNQNDAWLTVVDKLPRTEKLPGDLVDSIGRKPSPGKQLLLELGNRGFTVKSFIKVLDKARLVEPQLVLRRKFVACKFVKDAQARRANDQIIMECVVLAFPYASFEWTCEAGTSKEPVVVARTASFSTPFCGQCTRTGTYRCAIRNSIPVNADWSADYDRSPPTSSSLTSACVEVNFDSEKVAPICDACHQQLVLQKVGDLQVDDDAENAPVQNVVVPSPSHKQTEPAIATDKVALIISNSEYSNLTPLTTPPCDAQLLAECLLSLQFKTVVVSDLSLEEMKHLVHEFMKLLGAGVYAVFYFVGHGFEHAGKCYLLPVDAPGPENYSCADCVSVNWILSMIQQHDPSLNLVLLDMCRKQPPINLDYFLSTGHHYEYKLNRNTVYGYATLVLASLYYCFIFRFLQFCSHRAGAFEVEGENNGVFMKYLKQYVQQPITVIDMLSRVMADVEHDPKAGPEQVPEIRSNLSRKLSLCDPLNFTGHTDSFDQHSMHWQTIYELPDPINVELPDLGMMVTVWLDYCGNFCNMCFVFTSVTQLQAEDNQVDSGLSDHNNHDPINSTHIAKCQFAPALNATHTTKCNDLEEGVSMRTLVKALQKQKDELIVDITIWNTVTDTEVAQRQINFGQVLIMKL